MDKEKALEILSSVLNCYEGDLDDHESKNWYMPETAWEALAFIQDAIEPPTP